MSEGNQFAIIGLINSTDEYVDVYVKIGYQELHITSLAPGEETMQLTPTGAQWELRTSDALTPVDIDPPDEPEIAAAMSSGH